MTNVPMPVAIISWKPFQKNTLRGFATIRLGAALKINDVTVHRHANGKCWASFPSKQIMQADGTPKIGDNGKPLYAPILEWASKDASDRFSESVIGAIEADYPDATK